MALVRGGEEGGEEGVLVRGGEESVCHGVGKRW